MTIRKKKKKKFLKISVITLSSLILFSLIVFRVVTSSAFICGVVLPALSNSIGMRIDAGQVDLSVFKSRLTAKNISVGSGKTALAKAARLDASFSLSDLLKGRFVFRDVLLDKAIITIAKDSDGKWTYESPGQASAATPATETAPAGPVPPIAGENGKAQKILLDLKNIQITNSTFILTTGDGGKAPARMEFRDLNINLPEFRNNKAADLTFKSRLSIQSSSGISVKQGNWNFTLAAAFDDYLRPYEIKLASNLDKLDGTINGIKINNNNLTLNLEASGNKKSITIEQFRLRQMDKKVVKTDVRISSCINFSPFKIKGKLKIAPLSAEIVSIFCQFTRQVNPGEVGVNWLSDFEYSEAGFSGAGKLKLTRRHAAIIAGKKYALPDLRLDSKYNFRFNRSEKALSVKYFTVELQEQNKRVLLLSTDRAFTYLFDKKATRGKQKPQIVLQLRQLNLNLLKLLQTPNDNFILYGGRLDGDLAYAFGARQRVLFGANIKVSNLDFQIDSRRFKNLELEQKMSGSMTRKLFISIPELQLNIKNKQKSILNFAAAGNIDLKGQTADFSLKTGNFSSKRIKDLPLPPETIKKIVRITRKIAPFSVSAASSGRVKLDKGTIKLNTLNCSIFQQNKKVLKLSFRPGNGMLRNLGKNSEAVLTVADLSVKQFKKILEDDILKDGYLNGKIIAKIKNNWNSITLDSALRIDKLELLRADKLFNAEALRFNLGFTTSIINFDEINIRNFVCGIRRNKRLILGITGFGNLKPSNGAGEFNLALNHLDHHFLNILAPGKFKNGVIRGSLKVNILDHFKHLRIKSNLDIMRLSGGTLTETIDGKSSFDIVLKSGLFLCREFIIDLNGKNGKIAIIKGSTNNSGKSVLIKLSSKIIDLYKIKQLFARKNDAGLIPAAEKTSSGKAAASPAKPPEPWRFDFGKKTYVLLMDLRGIKYNSILTARINSKILGEGRRIAVKHLQIVSNKDKLNFQGDFLSTAKGIKYNLDLKSNKFNLSPVFRTFLADNLQAMEGTLKNLHINLAGTGLRPASLWDNMTGFAGSDFTAVKIPNRLSDTPIGRIILLPFEIMIDIQKMIPGKTLKAIGKASRFVLDFRDNIKILSFNKGKMDLKTRDGIIFIRDFHFNGNVVKNLSFAGRLGLGSRPVLDLKSRLNVNGIILPVDIAGTVQNPRINYSATTINFMTANAFNIIDTTGKILKEDGGAKEVLDTIFSIKKIFE